MYTLSKVLLRLVVVLYMFSSIAWSENNDKNVSEETVNPWADDLYHYITRKMYTFSHHLDKKLSEKLTDDTYILDVEKKSDDQDAATEDLEVNEWFSTFFRDELFEDEYRKSNMRLKTTYTYDHKNRKYAPSLSLKMNLALPRAKEGLNIFIGREIERDENRNYAKTTDEDIGIRYFLPFDTSFKTYVSAGFHNFDNPYVKTKAWLPFGEGQWRNRIQQEFEWSKDDRFSEETDLYFDRLLEEDAFLRFHLQRSSKSDIHGMTLFGEMIYNKTTKYDRGYQIGLSAFGETKPESQVNEYAAYAVWKKNIFRKWLYYEIEPRVEWERAYDFDANYKVLVSLEVFFGSE